MKLRHVELHTARMAEATEFYRLLGLTEIVDERPHLVVLACGADGGTISLLRFAVPPTAAGGPIIYFECADVDEEYRRLSDAGLVFAFPPLNKRRGRKEAGLVDPDGRVVCIYENIREP